MQEGAYIKIYSVGVFLIKLLAFSEACNFIKKRFQHSWYWGIP